MTTKVTKSTAKVQRKFDNLANSRTPNAATQAAMLEARSYKGLKSPSFLETAEALITGNRQQEYGATLQNFSQIAMLWQGTLATKLQADVAITPEDVALCMMQVKIARLAKSPDHADSILDVAGYAGCYNKLQTEREQSMPLAGAIVDPRA
jgi:hypothetical protein